MITLELFISSHCISAPSAIAVAKECARQVPGIRLFIRSDKEARARTLGIFIYPAFVVDEEIFAVGEPEREQLTQLLRQNVEQKKHCRDVKDL